MKNQTETNDKTISPFPAYAFDPDIEKVFAAIGGPAGLKAKRGDWKAMRDAGNAAMTAAAGQALTFPDVKAEDFSTISGEGAVIPLKWFYKEGVNPGPAVVYAHGGAMIMGSVTIFHSLIAQHVSETGVPFLAVEYRKAPDTGTGTQPASDILSGLEWLIGRAGSLGVDPERIALMGHSAGGGLAAGAAILARDRKINVARQILVYPMLDDRNTDPKDAAPIAEFITFTHDNNFTGWHALLGDKTGTDAVPPVSAPGRLKDFAGLPPAFIEIGELDIFRNETIKYVLGLSEAGVPVEFHLHAGAPHGFDDIPSKLKERALADRFSVIRSL